MERETIRKYVEKIVRTFGSEYDPNPSYTNTPTLDTYMQHSAYDLDLRSNTNNVQIRYDNHIVYDELEGIYEHGLWQEILEEYYNKIPAILKRREEAKKEKEKLEEIYKRIKGLMLMEEKETKTVYVDGCFSDHHDYEKVQLSTNLKIIGDHHTKFGTQSKILKLYYCGKEVFSQLDEERFGNYDWPEHYISYPTYIPGEWEQEIINLEKKQKEEKKEKIKTMHLNTLNTLRNL